MPRPIRALALLLLAAAPLQGQDVPEAVLYVDTHARREPFDAATVAFFDALVSQVAVALRSAVLYERLVKRADGLEANVENREAELVRLRHRWERVGGTAPTEVPGLVGISPGIQEVLRLIESLEGDRKAIARLRGLGERLTEAAA